MTADDDFINDCVHRLLTARGWDETERELRSILADAPRTPARMSDSEREAVKWAAAFCTLHVEHLDSRGREHVVALDRLSSEPAAPPSPLTVAQALMLPEVRSGAKWLAWKCSPFGAPVMFRFVDTNDYRGWEGHEQGIWRRATSMRLEDLDIRCALVDPQPEKDHKEHQP